MVFVALNIEAPRVPWYSLVCNISLVLFFVMLQVFVDFVVFLCIMNVMCVNLFLFSSLLDIT